MWEPETGKSSRSHESAERGRRGREAVVGTPVNNFAMLFNVLPVIIISTLSYRLSLIATTSS